VVLGGLPGECGGTPDLALILTLDSLSPEEHLKRFRRLVTDAGVRTVGKCVALHVRARVRLPKDHPLRAFPFIPCVAINALFESLLMEAVYDHSSD
jgi:hypothetical protein